MNPPNTGPNGVATFLFYVIHPVLILVQLTIIICARKRMKRKRVLYTEKTSRKEKNRVKKEYEESSARSDVWDDYDKKIEKVQEQGKRLKTRTTHSDEKLTQPTAKEIRDTPEDKQKRIFLDPQDFFEALKKPPPDVDLNDFIIKAAITQTVVNPLLVKKIGNIDDVQADPKKRKEQLQRLDEQMKSADDSTEREKRDSKAPKPKAVKWGDSKCVMYETRDQLTLEDDGEDAGEMA